MLPKEFYRKEKCIWNFFYPIFIILNEEMNSPEKKSCYPSTGAPHYKLTKLPYNKTSAKELSSPVFYTDVCNSSVNQHFSHKIKDFTPVIEKPVTSREDVNSKMCHELCSEGQSHSDGLLVHPPVDSNNTRTSLSQDSSNSSPVLLKNSGVNSSALDDTRSDTNTFLSADSNFRKYPFKIVTQSGNAISTNCNTRDCNRNENELPNSVLERESVESESQQNKNVEAGISAPEIIIVSLSDDEENKTNTELEHEANISGSSSEDIEIIPHEIPEPVMPQLSPLGSDIYIDDESHEQKSVKEIEVIELPDSPEMPTLVPVITESPKVDITTRTCTPTHSKTDSNFNYCDSSSSRDINECDRLCDSVHSNTPSTINIRQPKVVLTRLPVGHCSTIQLSGVKFICSEEPSPQKDVVIAKKGPEVDTIDGLNFFSFASKPEMEKYCEEHSSNLLFNIKKESFITGEPFFTDTSEMHSIQANNMTHVKSWESDYVSDIFDNDDDDDELYQEKSIQNKNNSISQEGRTSDLVNHLPKEGEEINMVEFSKNEPISLFSNSSNMVSLVPNQEHLEMSPKSKGVFCSDKLDEFLKNSSKLQVMWLQKTNPNITPIPLDAPILSIGKLRKDVDDNDVKTPETSFSSVSLRHQTLIKNDFDEEQEQTSNFSKGKFNNSFSSLTDDKESTRYSVSNMKRKAISLVPTKKLKPMKSYKSEVGAKRLVLTLKKENSGLCDGYKVASVSSACIEKESSALSPKTSPKSVNNSHKNPPEYYKEILFSPLNKKKEYNLVEQFIRNFNSLGTRKGVTMLVNSNRSPFVNCAALPSKCATVVEFLDSFIQKQKHERTRGRPKKRKSFTNLVVTPKQGKVVKSKASHAVESASVMTPNQSAEFCSSESPYFPSLKVTEEGTVSLRNKRSTRLPQRLLDSAILAPGSEWVSPVITEDSEITPKRSRKSELKKVDEVILDTPNSDLKEKRLPDNADKDCVAVENEFGAISIGSHMTVASGEPNNSISIPVPSSENKRICSYPLCCCNNTTRAMTYHVDMKRLVCSCALSMLTGYASLSKDSVSDSCEKTLSTPLLENLVLLQQLEKQKQETQVSGKSSERCKELGLHNYAINPNLKSKEVAIQVKSKSPVHLSKLSFQENLKDLDTSANSQLSKMQVAENTILSTIENVIKVPDVKGNDEGKITYPVTLASPNKNCDDALIDVEEEGICLQQRTHGFEQHNDEELISMKVISTSDTGHPIESSGDEKNVPNREDAVPGSILNQTVWNCEQVIARPLNFSEKSSVNTISKTSPALVHTNKKINYAIKVPVNFNSILGLRREGVLGFQKPMQVSGSTSSSNAAITPVTTVSPKMLYLTKTNVPKKLFQSSPFLCVNKKNLTAFSTNSSKINPGKSSSETPVVLSPSAFQRSPIALKNFVPSSLNHTLQSMNSRQDLTVVNQQSRTITQSVINVSSNLEEKSSTANNVDATNCTDGTNKPTELFTPAGDLIDAQRNPSFEQPGISDSDLILDVETVDDNFFTDSQQKDCSSKWPKNSRESKENDILDVTSSSSESEESVVVDQNAKPPISDRHGTQYGLKKAKEKLRRLEIRKNMNILQKALGRKAANMKNLLQMAEDEMKILAKENKNLNVTIFKLLSHRQNLQKIYRRHALRLPPAERKAEATSLLHKLRSAVCPEGSRSSQGSQSPTEVRENSPEIEVLPVPKKEAECIDLVESDEEIDLKASPNEKLSDDEDPSPKVLRKAEQSKDSLHVQNMPETRQAQVTQDTLFNRWTTAFQVAQPSSSRHAADVNTSTLSSQPSTNFSAIGVQNQKSSVLPSGVRLVSFKPFGSLTSPLDRTKFKEAQQILNSRIALKTSSSHQTLVSTSSSPDTGQKSQCQIPILRLPESAFGMPIQHASKTGHERIQNMFNAMQQINRPSPSASNSKLSVSGSIVVRPPVPMRSEPEMLLNVGGNNVYQWTTPRTSESDSVGNVLPSNSSTFTLEESSPVKVADVVSLSCSKNNDSVS